MTLRPASGWDVVVFLPSDWAAVEAYNTRWKRVVTSWALRHDVRTVTVVDVPRWSWRRVVHPSSLVTRQQSWLPGVTSLRLTLPLRPDPTPWDGLALERAARSLRRHLPGAGSARLIVSATPLMNPLAARVPAARVCFDAVDDWRDYGPVRHLRARVEAGYAASAQVHACSAVSGLLAQRLHTDYGTSAVLVPNGAPVWSAADLVPSAGRERLAHGYAVYVGSVDDRLDLAALASLRESVPDLELLFAGRVQPELQEPLAALGVRCLGLLPHAEVPALLAGASVGLLPHRPGLSSSQSSMKLLEYLAAGLPVVTTPHVGTDHHRVVQQRPDERFGAAALRAVALGRVSPSTDVRTWQDVADDLWALYVASPESQAK